MASKLWASRIDLHSGAIVGTIAHAIWLNNAPEFEGARSWTDHNYNTSDGSGGIATVTFDPDNLVALFFDPHSDKRPYVSGTPFDGDRVFGEMPANLRILAEREAMQFMLQERDGARVALVTAAFWSDGDDLWASSPWMSLREDGAGIVDRELRGVEEGIPEWQENYGLTEDETTLLRSIAERRIANPGAPLILSAGDKEVLLARGVPDGEAASRRVFAQVGITLP